jgi:hypothetical protein
MEPVPPFWFRQRQGKMEAAGESTWKLTAPNLAEAFIHIRKGDDGGWVGVLLPSPTGPERAATTNTYANPLDAWQAAFELHRTHLVT